ncbi:MAG: hypothetical protein ACK5NT_12750 [Pyrinomonadaceae bacterium]
MNSQPGIFALSLDFELIWGTADKKSKHFENACKIERDFVVDRLLQLFQKHDISATWATVGHLFLDNCEPVDGIKHPEIERTNFSWLDEDWFFHDPGGSECDGSIHLARSLVEKIRDFPVYQEIGSHGFSHIILGDSETREETVKCELHASVKAAKELGIELKSFVFPRNIVGDVGLLREAGFTNYRGVEPNWYEVNRVPQKLKRILRLVDVVAAVTPPVVEPEIRECGIVNIPGSMLYFPSHGKRKYIPNSRRVIRAKKGIMKAAIEGRIFHFWFHPTNMVDEAEQMFSGLDLILQYVSELREKGILENLTMGEIAERAGNL